jgi:hypothetical protein
MQPTAIVNDTASKPEAACRSLAPTACNPARTTINDDVNPTSDVTIPALIGSAYDDWDGKDITRYEKTYPG